MTTSRANPFDVGDLDRHELWTMLVERDIAAFVAGDWETVAGDFAVAEFSAVDAGGQSDPDRWSLSFATLADYRASWLAQSEQFRRNYDEPAGVLYAATTLDHIEVVGERALAHKTFDGWAVSRSGRRSRLAWKTIYQCRRDGGRWRISGFIGYLPLDAAPVPAPRSSAAVTAPDSSQHTTAGAYSPVLRVEAAQLVVISGQAALDRDGNVITHDVSGQTIETLASCERQLAAAGAALDDVFKVNVYLADIADWAAFDTAYRSVMAGRPLPVRTAVGVALLPGLVVEIEMWAATDEGR